MRGRGQESSCASWAWSPRERTDEAIHDNPVLTDLMPGFWQAQMALAWAYVRLDVFQEGLAAAAAKELIGARNSSPNSHIVHYVEAVALQGLGRRAEAIAAAQRSLAARPNIGAQQRP